MPFDRDRQDSRGGRPRGRRKKVCSFCVDRIDHIDYKDIDFTGIQRAARLTPCGPFLFCAKAQVFCRPSG